MTMKQMKPPTRKCPWKLERNRFNDGIQWSLAGEIPKWRRHFAHTRHDLDNIELFLSQNTINVIPKSVIYIYIIFYIALYYIIFYIVLYYIILYCIVCYISYIVYFALNIVYFILYEIISYIKNYIIYNIIYYIVLHIILYIILYILYLYL